MSMNADIAVAKTRIDTDLQGIQVADISFDNGKKKVPVLLKFHQLAFRPYIML